MEQAPGEVGRVQASALDEVLGRFGLGQAATARLVAEGLMNRNWAVTTSGGARVFVKQVLDVSAEQARLQHAATRALAARGLPVAVPVAGPGGQTLADVDGGLFAVYPWVAGTHVPGPRMSVAQAGELGAVLGRLHRELDAVMPAAGQVMTMPLSDPAVALQAISQYEALIAERPVPDEFDEYAAGQLRRRRSLLESAGPGRPDPAAPWEPCGWAHGDFHDLNVLWDERGALAAVLDFDRLGPRPYALELVRSATLTFGHGDERGLDLVRVRAFTTGYREVLPLTAAQVRQAVRRLWWERACDLWQLKRHYLRDDGACDHLFTSASALLWWWTARQPEVEAAFTSP